MSINLLIDTSNLLRLLNILEKDRNIHKLSVWLNREEIQLYIPDTLLLEWEKNKKIKLAETKDDVTKLIKKHKVDKAFPSLGVDPPEIDIAQIRLTGQIEIIDRWIHFGIKYGEGPASVKARQQQKTESLPPFQGGKDSEKDAIIIFSTLDRLSTQKQPTLYFVSANTTDFSQKENHELKLHPAIVARFPSVTVKYFETLNHFVEHATHTNLLNRRPETVSDNTRLLQNFTIDPARHPIDQLYDYLTARFSTIKFLPRSLYAPHPPFALNTARDLFDRPFTISTNNKHIYDLLRSFNIIDGRIDTSEIANIQQVEQAEEKARYILETLNFNFGHNVSWLQQEQTPIAAIERDISDTLTGQFQRLNLAGLWTKLAPAEHETIDSLMEKGYLHYKLGNYVASAQIYQQARTLAEKENNYNQTFFSIFNLSKLAQILAFLVEPSAIPKDLQADLQSIDLLGDIAVYSKEQNKNILSWMSDNRFISEGIAELASVVSDIDKLEHQHSSGWNSDFLQVLNTYFEVDNFLAYNHIVFDQFAEFDKLTRFFLQGLFASYASNQRLRGQIEQFPDWLLETLMLNGNADTIKYYFSKYELQGVNYRVDKIDYFEQTLLPFLYSFNDVRLYSDRLDNATRRNFNDQLDKYLNNAIILIAITNIRQDLETALITSIHQIVEESINPLDPPTFDHLNFLFFIKYKRILPDIATQFLITLLVRKIRIKDILYTNLIQILKAKNEPLTLTAEQFAAFSKNWLVLERNELDFPETVIAIHDILENGEQKASIVAFISETLHEHFSHRLLYLADFSNLIVPTAEHIGKFEAYLIARLSPLPPDSVIRRVPLRYPYAIPVDQYIHFSQQHDHPIPPQLRSNILDVDPYYQWILAPEDFDYANFIPQWLQHDLSKALKTTLQSSDSLKRHLTISLRANKDNEMLWAFYELFNI